jgi:hypothetical protein
MSDLLVMKQLDRSAAAFLRFAGPDKYVIEVDGSEPTIARDFWRVLPHLDPHKAQLSRTV